MVARLDDSNHRRHLAVEEASLALAQAQLDETRTSTEKALIESFMRQFGDIGTITTLILGAGFFTMLLVAANTMSQAVRERISEMAILKTLGFSNQSVLLMILAESKRRSTHDGTRRYGWAMPLESSDQARNEDIRRGVLFGVMPQMLLPSSHSKLSRLRSGQPSLGRGCQPQESECEQPRTTGSERALCCSRRCQSQQSICRPGGKC